MSKRGSIKVAWLATFFAIVGGFARLVPAQPTSPTTMPSTAPAAATGPVQVQITPEIAQKYLALEQQVAAAFAQQMWADAVKPLQEQMALIPQHPGPHYNLACARAHLGEIDQAIESLSRSMELGFSGSAHLRQDPDLTSLHGDERFKKLVEQARANELKGPYEHGQEIEGIKTVEDYPEDGLRYRLRLSPDATDEKPNRLIVWLHPSGGSMDETVEAMSPMLIQHRYALLVLTQKNYSSWAGEDLLRVLAGTVSAVEKVPGIDAKKPILMGFSAGGQAALLVWKDNPEAFGGLILNAAYPVLGQDAQGRVIVIRLPEGEKAGKTPMFVVIGDKDNGSLVWKQIEKSWLAKGVPLTMKYVPDQGHTWLFDAERQKMLATWLDAVHAGKLPSDPAPAATQPTTQASTTRPTP